MKNQKNSFKNFVNLMYSTILNIIFPPVCGFCNKLSPNYVCEDCKRKNFSIKAKSN